MYEEDTVGKSSLNLLLMQTCTPYINGVSQPVSLVFPGRDHRKPNSNCRNHLHGQSTTIYSLSKRVSVLFQLDVCRQDFGCLVQLNQRSHQVSHLERVDGEVFWMRIIHVRKLALHLLQSKGPSSSNSCPCLSIPLNLSAR